MKEWQEKDHTEEAGEEYLNMLEMRDAIVVEPLDTKLRVVLELLANLLQQLVIDVEERVTLLRIALYACFASKRDILSRTVLRKRKNVRRRGKKKSAVPSVVKKREKRKKPRRKRRNLRTRRKKTKRRRKMMRQRRKNKKQRN